ncbi:MAG TPA: hypothetical protein VGS41_12295, partial [Chthonomonadales bacterium]|nr:hypothetical protein [Chthonomonadales bacterium]
QTGQTTIQAGNLYLSGSGGISIASSALLSTPGPTTLMSSGGEVIWDGASVSAQGGLTVHGAGLVSGIGAFAKADNYLVVKSESGAINLNQSTFSPFDSSASKVRVSVTAPGTIGFASCNWSIPGPINVDSAASDLVGQSATIDTGPGALPISLIAHGLLIDVTGATLVGPVTYGPSGVVVLGP